MKKCRCKGRGRRQYNEFTLTTITDFTSLYITSEIIRSFAYYYYYYSTIKHVKRKRRHERERRYRGGSRRATDT